MYAGIYPGREEAEQQYLQSSSTMGPSILFLVPLNFGSKAQNEDYHHMSFNRSILCHVVLRNEGKLFCLFQWFANIMISVFPPLSPFPYQNVRTEML